MLFFPYLFVPHVSTSRFRTIYQDKNRGKRLNGRFAGVLAAMRTKSDTKSRVSISPVTMLCMWVRRFFLLIALAHNPSYTCVYSPRYIFTYFLWDGIKWKISWFHWCPKLLIVWGSCQSYVSISRHKCVQTKPHVTDRTWVIPDDILFKILQCNY